MMSNERKEKNSRNRVKGDGNVFGDGNVVDNRREEHHHHHKGGSSGGGDGDPRAMIFGAAIVMAVICWSFVRYADTVYFYLKAAALLALVPYASVLVQAYIPSAPSMSGRQMVAAMFGTILSGFTFILVDYGQGRLDPQLLQFGRQAQNAWVFWKGLSAFGQKLVLGNVLGAVALGVGSLLCLLMGVYVLWHYMSDAEDAEDSVLLRLLDPFRPRFGGVLTTLLLLMAWAFESSFVFDLWRPMVS